MQLLDELNALLITNPTNIRYLTGFVGAAPEEREAYCMLSNSQTYLFVNQLYSESANKLALQSKQGSNNPIIPALPAGRQSSNNPIKIIAISRDNPFTKKLAEILTGPGPVNRLGFEEDNVTVAEYTNLKKELPGITLVPTRGRIEQLRMIKRKYEIVNIRAAAKLTDLCFDFILGKLKESVTESQIAWEIESFIKTRGASLAFSPIVAFGPNTSQPHYQVQPQGLALRLSAPNIVLLDFGARVNGYCSDMTRVVFIGKPEAKWLKAYDAVLRAQTASLEYLASRPGLEATGSKTDRIARDILEKAGFPTYPHSLGHGVGLDIHETPRLTINPSTRSARSGLQPGMVVTVEPGIYMEGQYGIRIEDLILLKEDGIEILSKSNKNVIVL